MVVGHAWQGVCVAVGGGVHGRGVHGRGVCMVAGMAGGACMAGAGGHAWQGACVAGGMCGRDRGHAWQGQGGMHGRGACMAGGIHGRGGMRARVDTMGYGQ